MDKFTKEKRSDIMSRVRGKNTKPEEIVRKYLFSKGFRYRKNFVAKVSYGDFYKRMLLASASQLLVRYIARNK